MACVSIFLVCVRVCFWRLFEGRAETLCSTWRWSQWNPKNHIACFHKYLGSLRCPFSVRCTPFNSTSNLYLLDCMVTYLSIIFCVYLNQFHFSFLVCHRSSDYILCVVPCVVQHNSPNGFIIYAFPTFHSLFLRHVEPFSCCLRTIRNGWWYF